MEMDRLAFRELLTRYLNNQCSDRERQLVEQWYSYLDKEVSATLDDSDAALEQELWARIEQQTDTPSSSNPFKKIWLWTSVSLVAASLLLILRTQPNQTIPTTVWDQPATLTQCDDIRIIKADSVQLSLHLPDSSNVLLEPHSSIAYNPSFTERHVQLTGKAYFKVKEDTNRPFQVHSNGLITKVLGTSFTINTQKENFEVVVHTGTVQVEAAGKADRNVLQQLFSEPVEVLLTSNKKAIYSKEEDEFIIQPIDLSYLPVPIPSTGLSDDAYFLLESAQLIDVVRLLTTTYHKTITIERSEMFNCPITADLRATTFIEKLEIIASATGMHITHEKDSILLSGGNCS